MLQRRWLFMLTVTFMLLFTWIAYREWLFNDRILQDGTATTYFSQALTYLILAITTLGFYARRATNMTRVIWLVMTLAVLVSPIIGLTMLAYIAF